LNQRQRDEGRGHGHVAMRKVDDVEHAEDQAEAYRQQCVYTTKGYPVYQLLDKQFRHRTHLSI
jgi:hypothetical protein